MGTIKLKKMSEAQAEEPNAEIFFRTRRNKEAGRRGSGL